MQAIALSKAPVIASHSGARALCDHSRNMDDELLLALKKNGGVVQTVALLGLCQDATAAIAERQPRWQSSSRSSDLPAGVSAAAAGADAVEVTRRRRGAAATGAGARHAAGGRTGGRGRGRGSPLAQLSDEKRAEAEKRLGRLNAKYPPPPRASVKDFVDHIDYVAKKIGIDHVGISSDFDGGGGIDGWNDASETFNVTLELVRRGYTEEQIGKIWSGNLLRVMEEVRKVARVRSSAESVSHRSRRRRQIAHRGSGATVSSEPVRGAVSRVDRSPRASRFAARKNDPAADALTVPASAGASGRQPASVGQPGAPAVTRRISADAARSRSGAVLRSPLIAPLKVGPIRPVRHGIGSAASTQT